MKSVGSISHVPVLPYAARVSIFAPSATRTDLAAPIFERSRPDDTGVVARLRLHRALVDHIVYQPVARKQGRAAAIGLNRAVVLHPQRDERHHATRHGMDHALVDDRSGDARIGKPVTARQKIAVGHIETRRDDTANIDLRRLASKRIPPF